MLSSDQQAHFTLPSGPITVSEFNIEAIREQIPSDQAAELEIGCVTWAFEYNASNFEVLGRMTIWPTGRGAIEFGSDSFWGEWDYQDEELTTDDGMVFSRAGIELRDSNYY